MKFVPHFVDVRRPQTENEDLFFAVPWSHGTLGFLVAVELRIIPAKKYVRLTYEPTYSLEETVSRLEAAAALDSPSDFVESLVYARDKSVVMTGVMTDDAVPEQVMHPRLLAAAAAAAAAAATKIVGTSCYPKLLSVVKRLSQASL